ncbi:TonB-dependent receptor [Stakelama tenebrarum]|uniref:TonB-dependent receptor n=1 Tax=Stakelama tenebrarum TaxID=2711215 RepID=A0A6G6Y3B4_9SPHN|nr:TonB-dependent receptor [Sphingosinithalassobacter tenebrarum]QIG79390.1 TonB-dependent receptor [Sphingosinithalassobacter tenebrarum]
MITTRMALMQGSALAAALILPSTAALAQDGTSASQANEIVVTATKRDETLSDVPLAVSVLTGEDLQDMNAQSLSDYIVRLPGVVFNDYQPGVSEVVIRGVAATTYHEQGQTTTGYYLNETPMSEPGFPIGIPDVDTFDLARVEVLRGPQGTLFGSSSLGGAVNYVVATADPTGFDAAASGLIGTTKNSDGDVNYAGKLMVNVPVIADVLAIRGVAIQRVDAGYLDNFQYGEEGSNDLRTRGLRGSIVLTPAVGTKLTYLSSYQDTQLDDQTYLDVTNPYVRNTPRLEPQSTGFWLNSLKLEQDLGFASLTAFGSIVDKDNRTVFSYPYAYVTGVTTGEDAAYSLGEAEANIKYGEARLASNGDGPISWLIGASYMYSTKYSYDQTFQNGAEAYIDANPGAYGGVPGSVLAPGDRIYGYISDSETKDFGVFGEIGVELMDGLTLTVGGRYYSNSYETTVINQASANSGSTIDVGASVDQSEDGFTPKVTLSMRPSDDFMAYVTYSQGYRIGGINPNAGLLATIPQSYDSDTVDNYEFGVKMSLFDRKLFVDATVYSLDWSGIQARLFGPAPTYYSYVTNAGGANVAGVELAATFQPISYVSYSTSISYTDAKLTDFLPDTFAVGGGYASGTRLPGSSEWSISNTLHFNIGEGENVPTLEFAHRYLSEAPTAFNMAYGRGDFNIFDVRATIAVLDQFKIMAFANNVFDEYGVLNAPFADSITPSGSIVRPRTIGLRIDWSL